MWHLGTWFSGGIGSVVLMVGLDLKGLFRHKRLFYDSVVNDHCFGLRGVGTGSPQLCFGGDQSWPDAAWITSFVSLTAT